jgi:FlaA1/EpsC-like NDP-sugar epimerase
VETRKAGIGYVGSTLLCGVLMYVFYRMGINKAAWHMTYYSNPLLIIAAISLVLLFKNFQFSSKFINKVALSSVAIYLVQSSIAGSGLYRVIKYLYNNYEIGGGYRADNLCVIYSDVRFLRNR